jgi:hypothetical protein
MSSATFFFRSSDQSSGISLLAPVSEFHSLEPFLEDRLGDFFVAVSHVSVGEHQGFRLPASTTHDVCDGAASTAGNMLHQAPMNVLAGTPGVNRAGDIENDVHARF